MKNINSTWIKNNKFIKILAKMKLQPFKESKAVQ